MTLYFKELINLEQPYIQAQDAYISRRLPLIRVPLVSK